MNMLAIVRIDSHQHFWALARGDYAWLWVDSPTLAPLRRDFLPADLEPLLQQHQVTHTVLVQATDMTTETDFILALARQAGFVAGIVGWVDLSRADAVATLERWAREPKFKGVRPMLQDLAAADWIVTAPRRDAVDALKRLGLRFDALVKPRHLEPLLRFVRQHPDLPVVIDHAAKPQLAHGWTADWAETWRRHMAQLAGEPQVMCKLSGLLTEASAASCRTVADAVNVVRPVWDHLLCYGPSRLMWGSDWPVLTLASDYATWVQASSVLIDELSVGERARVWRETAQRFYGLDVVEPVG
jgi:L-fuconolactonase